MKWKATTKNGEIFTQEICSYDLLPREQIVTFGIYDGETPKIVIDVKQGENFFYRRRVTLTLDGKTNVSFILGITRKDYSKTDRVEIGFVCVLRPDKSIRISSDFVESDKELYPIVFSEYER